MWIRWFPFGFYGSLLKIPTLPTKIREKTWDLDKLIMLLRQTKSEIKKVSSSKPSAAKIQKLKDSISKLAAEIKRGIKDLMYISFYDSAMFYLYYRLLNHIFNLCKQEEERLSAKEKEALSKDKNLGDIKKTKMGIEREIKSYEKLIKELKLGEKHLIKDYEKLVKKLRTLRWAAEKQAQHEFSFLKLTLRGMNNLNRKIKVEAIKVKKDIVPQESFLLRRIERKGQSINPQDVIQLAKLVSDAIQRISKDMIYSFKLISKFEGEVKKLKSTVENLKNRARKSNKVEETNITKPCDDSIKYVEKQINKDLRGIFGNIFVEYKYIGTRPIRKAA